MALAKRSRTIGSYRIPTVGLLQPFCTSSTLSHVDERTLKPDGLLALQQVE